MARRSGSGGGSGGGDDGSKKRNVALGFLEEAAEFATGVLAGSAMHSVLRAGASGAIRGMKGGLFERLFGSGRSKTDDAKAEDISSAPGKLLRSVTDASGDAKLGQLAQEYLANIIAIQTSGRDEAGKAKAIEEAKAAYKAAVNEYLLSKTKSSLQNLMAELSDMDKSGGRTPPAGRPVSYREDFIRWLQQELAPAQREMIMARRSKISSVRVITDMLDFSANAAQRFEYMTFTLGEPDAKGIAGELVRSAINGCLEEHPTVRKVGAWSEHNVADRQQRAETTRRAFRNRRKV